LTKKIETFGFSNEFLGLEFLFLLFHFAEFSMSRQKKSNNKIMKFFKKLAVSVLCFGSVLSFAQESDLGAWYMYFGNNKISKKLNFHNEIQYRNFDGIGDLEQLLIRTGIGYDLTENNNNVLLGYGFILSQPYVNGEKSENIEHRIFQQFITKQQFGRFNLQHRYRLEERFLQDDFRMRFRYLLGLNIPINNKEMLPKTLYISAYNEIFLNLDSPVFDRNRVYGALGFIINKNMRIEAGYMNQLQENKNRGQIQIGFYNNIPFTKN